MAVKSNINQYQNKFEIITDGGAQITEIDEPIEWEGQETILKRDSKWHGVNYEFTDAEVPLRFDCRSARQLLVDLYNQFGNDAIAFLRFSSLIDGVWVAEPDMQIDFNFFDDDYTTVGFTLKRTSFEDLFRTRFSVEVDITRDTNLDGDPITPLSAVDLELHSKNLFLATDRLFSDENPDAGTPPFKSSDLLELRFEDDPIVSSIGGGDPVQTREVTMFAQPSFGKIIFDDIKLNQNVPFGISITGPNPQYVLEEAGLLDIDFGLAFNASLHVAAQWRQPREDLKIEGCSRGDATQEDARMTESIIRVIVQINEVKNVFATYTSDNSGCDLRVHQTGYFFQATDTGGVFDNVLRNDFVSPETYPIPGSAPPQDLEGYLTTKFDDSGLDKLGDLVAPAAVDIQFVTGSLSNIPVNKGDEISVYVEIYGKGDYERAGVGASDVGWFAQAVFYNEDFESPANQSFLQMSLNSEAETTQSFGYLAHETLDKLIEINTGLNARLRSSFLGRADIGYIQDGCGAFNAIVNGFGIRNFNVDSQPPNTSLEEFMDNFRAIYNMGYNFGKEGADDVIRFEETPFFYQDNLIHQFDDPSNFRIKIDSENIYNEIQIGYESFQQDGINLIDEPNTRRTWTTPIRSEKKKLDILASYISSGYTIEFQRREQFNESPSNALDWDESIFIIAVRLDGLDWKSEKDEDFITVNNVFAPETSYNLKLTPARMLYRWGESLKGMLRYKSVTLDPLRFISGFKNNELETETNNACEQPGLIKESNNILIKDWPDNNNGLFSPELITFEDFITWPEFEKIRNALQGNSVLGDNYGYISVKDPDGTLHQGWPMEIKYNKVRGKVQITLRRRWL